MNKFYFLIAAVMAAGTISSAALIPAETLKIKGYDLRNKSDKYELVLKPEDTLLEERAFELRKINGKKSTVVAEGVVLYDGADKKAQTEAIWSSENYHLKIGDMVGADDPRQLFVFKVKDKNQTYIFQKYH